MKAFRATMLPVVVVLGTWVLSYVGVRWWCSETSEFANLRRLFRAPGTKPGDYVELTVPMGWLPERYRDGALGVVAGVYRPLTTLEERWFGRFIFWGR